MRLSKRIYKISELVNEGNSVADIGTDHGYVPMLLMKEGKSPRAIMSDISAGSLSKAKETFELTGLTNKVSDSDFRVGDGLSTIKEGEVDEVIIAGLGGHTIADILSSDKKKAKSFKRLVLQPRKYSGSLRYYLYTNGWDIESENLAPEGKFVCEIITAVPSKDKHREPPYPEDDIRWKYPAELFESDPELARKRVSYKIGSIDEQIGNLMMSKTAKDDDIDRLKHDKSYLAELIGNSEIKSK